MKAASTLPLTLVQRDHLFLPTVNHNLSIRFKGELSVPTLRRALAFIMRRHEALRMRVVRSSGNQPQQCLVKPIDSYDIPITCVENFVAIEDHIKTCLAAPTDLEKNGPLRAELIRVSENEHVLLLVIHAIVIDAHAVGLFIRDLLLSYDCYARGQDPSLPPAMSYSEYVLNEARCGETLSDAQVQYWRSVLSGSRNPISMREDRSAPSAARLRVVASSITSTETQRLQEFSAAANVSMAAAIYAIIFLAVSSQYSADDILATVAYSGRDSHVLATLGARTARSFPLRMVMNNGTPLAEVARKIQTIFMQGVIASRPPFTPERAIAQALGERRPAPSGEGEKEGVPLFILDHMYAQKKLEVATPHLSAERIILDPQAFDMQEVPETSPFLNISLRRDLGGETGRPVTFVGWFCQPFIGESEVNRLLERMCDIARITCRENQNATIGEVVFRVPNSSPL